jgi:hypothetical protein
LWKVAWAKIVAIIILSKERVEETGSKFATSYAIRASSSMNYTEMAKRSEFVTKVQILV